MDDTITAIDTIALRIPLDIWAPAPMSSQGVPRTHVDVNAAKAFVGYFRQPASTAVLKANGLEVAGAE